MQEVGITTSCSPVLSLFCSLLRLRAVWPSQAEDLTKVVRTERHKVRTDTLLGKVFFRLRLSALCRYLVPEGQHFHK